MVQILYLLLSTTLEGYTAVHLHFKSETGELAGLAQGYSAVSGEWSHSLL